MIEVIQFERPIIYKVGTNIFAKAEERGIEAKSKTLLPGFYDFTPVTLKGMQNHKVEVYEKGNGLYIVSASNPRKPADGQVTIYRSNDPLQSALTTGYRVRIPEDEPGVMIGTDNPIAHAGKIVYSIVRYFD